jgi:short subunit dehydrogenase-like uncharacterized protein
VTVARGAGWLLYGATGYTGGLIARAAARRGLRPILGGRNRARLAALASTLGLEDRVAPVEDLTSALDGVAVVLHAAGPYTATARAVADACLRSGVHYLDLSGELAAVLAVAELDAPARAGKVMLMPGAGCDVVATNCLSAHVARRVRDPVRLAIGISGLDLISRGSARSSALEFGRPVQVRLDGELVGVPVGSLRRPFDYGRGPRPSVVVSWADLAAGWYTTGIPNIEVYVEETDPVRWLQLMNQGLGWARQLPAMGAWLDLQASVLPAGPSAAERAGRTAVVVVEIEDAAGRVSRSRLVTPEVYGFTIDTTLALVARVLRGDFEPGFQTPGRVYGADFVMPLPGVSREDLDGC